MNANTVNELFNCPKCGSKARFVVGPQGDYVICSNHRCLQPGSGVFRDADDAKRAWNKNASFPINSPLETEFRTGTL